MNLDRVIAVRNDKTVFRDGDRCIKVFGERYAKETVLSEALCQASAEALGLPVPAVLEVTTVDGKWAIVSEYIRGKTLSRRMQEEPEHRAAHIARLVGLQLLVQQNQAPRLPSQHEKMALDMMRADLDPCVRISLLSSLDKFRWDGCLCHGDLLPSNIILTDGGAAYILDWSHATQGDAATDAAETYLLLLLGGDAAAAATYLHIFCGESGIKKQEIERRIPLVAAARMASANELARAFYARFLPTP